MKLPPLMRPDRARPNWRHKDVQPLVVAYQASRTPTVSRAQRYKQRALRTIAGLAIAVIASIGFATPTAHASYLWDMPDEVTAWAVNFCGPVDIPDLSNGTGMDTLLGTNTGRQELLEATGNNGAVPPSLATYHADYKSDSETGGQVGGIERLKEAGWKPGEPGDINDPAYWANNPSYLRYGFDTFKWPTYNISCGNIIALALNSIASTVFTISNMVLMWAMFVLQVATGSTLYAPLMWMLQPFIGVFGTLFKPLAYAAAVFGVVFIYFQSKGSISKILQAVLWAASILAITTFITESPGRFANAANNVVTLVGSSAAESMMQAAGWSNAACRVDLQRTNTGEGVNAVPDALMEGFRTEQMGDAEGYGSFQGAGSVPGSTNCVAEALWYGAAYQPWVAGLVGPNAEAQKYYGPAFLNAMYAVSDPQGRRQVLQRERWNSATEAFIADNNGAGFSTEGLYGEEENEQFPNDAGMEKGGTKVHLWAFGTTKDGKGGDGNEGYWRTNNFLGVIAGLCGSPLGTGHEYVDVDNVQNDARYYYCQPRNAVDSAAYIYLQGTVAHHRLFTALIALLNTLMISNVVGLVALYLMFKKVGFYFMLLFSGLILAVATWAGERGRAVGRGYGEVLLSNVVKQCIALVILLFVVYGFGLILAPQNMFGGGSDAIGEQLVGSHIGYLARPFLCLMFIMGLIAFYAPFKKFFTGVVRGDGAAAAQNLARLPHRTGKTAAKGAAIAAAAAATGGAAVAVGGGAAAGGGAMQAGLGGASKMLGTPVGKAVARGVAAKAGRKMFGQGGGIAAMAVTSGAAMDNLGKYLGDLADKKKPGTGTSPEDMLYAFKNQQAEKEGDPTRYGKGKGEKRMTPEELSGAAADVSALDLIEEKRRNGGPDTQEGGGLPHAKDVVNRAREQVDSAGFVDNGVVAQGVLSSSDIAKRYNLDEGATPEKLGDALPHVVEDIYRPNPGAMDPRHPATPALQQVMYEPDAKKQQAGLANAVQVIGEHGFPGTIDAIGSNTPMPGWANGMVSAIPALGASSTSMDRFAAANDIAALQMVSPAGSPISGQIQEYRESLLNTAGVSNADVNLLGQELARALGQHIQQAQPNAPMPAPVPVPMPMPQGTQVLPQQPVQYQTPPMPMPPAPQQPSGGHAAYNAAVDTAVLATALGAGGAVAGGAGVPGGQDAALREVAANVARMTEKLDTMAQAQQRAGTPTQQMVPLPPASGGILGTQQARIEALRRRDGGPAGTANATDGKHRKDDAEGAEGPLEDELPLEVEGDDGSLGYHGATTITGKRAEREDDGDGDGDEQRPDGPSFL